MALALAACGGAGSPPAPAAPAPRAVAAAPVQTPRVVGVRPHDPGAFTEGLVWHSGRLYESTGLYGRSDVRRVDPVSGRVLQSRRIPARFFGEGLAVWGPHLVQLTWKEGRAFVWRRSGLVRAGTRAYPGEGWGLATLGRHLVMSDGTDTLRVLDPSTFRVVRRVAVRDGDAPVTQINELEVVHGLIWANVWQTDDIVVIHPRTGRVVWRLDMRGLRARLPAGGRPEVLNGIAWDRRADRVLVTGKWWPRMFVIRP